MKIFVLLSRVPYPTEKGDKLRAFHQIKCLAGHHEVVLVALSHEKPHVSALPILSSFCAQVHFIRLGRMGALWNILRAFVLGKPFQVGYFYSKKASRKINQLLAETKPDQVYAQLVRVAEYLRTNNIPSTIDYQDVLSVGAYRRSKADRWWMKPLLLMEAARLREYEKRVFDWFGHWTIISVPDRDQIAHERRGEIRVIPNGVDTDFFRPMGTPKEYGLAFTGNMAYPPNVDAACFLIQEIMPLVWARVPGARVLLAGATPSARVRALQSPLVDVSGWMDDIRQAYASSRVFVAPMRIGTGLQNKILEAMAMGLPCVTTSLPNEALGAADGKQILIGNQPGEIASHIVSLLSDPHLAKQIGDAGTLFVKEGYSWCAFTQQLERLMGVNG